ncbi:MAG: hypothetical protein DLD55_00925 [candidate division SR1 bacterium]|nr:MAG: hypothetical protein DLD55_00925 [candidate division SR1 bacterium]
MQSLTSQEIRQRRSDFWTSKAHAHLPEASLIADKESTALFNVAGMQPLIPYLAGKPHPLGNQLFNIQKCVRTVDIDEVGDSSHLTFFEMMGNWSLGAYFKEEAIQWSYEFLVEKLNFDPRKLAVTVFEGNEDAPRDEIAFAAWKKAGIPEERISFLNAKNNWWSPGPVGPCGPDTEIFYRVGESEFPPAGSNVATDEDNWLEIWNNVFMEFYMKSEEDASEEIKKKINTLTEQIIGQAIDIHKKYKTSLTEKQIQNLLYDKLKALGYKVEKEKSIPIVENGKFYGNRYIDIVVNDAIFIELKNTSNEEQIKKGFRQTRNYLELGNGVAGLLLNFAFDKLLINRFNHFEGNAYQKLLQTSKISKLPHPNVDTGMGLERMCKVLQHKDSVYETDLFAPFLQTLEQATELKYADHQRKFRIIADHLRTAFMLINDGLTPSNVGAGYVLRMIIRRGYYNLFLLRKMMKPELEHFIDQAFVAFKGLRDFNEVMIKKVLLHEIAQFEKTIHNGEKILTELLEKLTAQGEKTLGGDQIFMLYDTYGFPLEITKELAADRGVALDLAGYEKALEAAKEKSRQGSKAMFQKAADWSKYLEGIPATEFVGYEQLEFADAKLLKEIDTEEGQKVLIFDKTPFYPEMGGQNGDAGVIELDDGRRLEIVNVQKVAGVILHFVG